MILGGLLAISLSACSSRAMVKPLDANEASIVNSHYRESAADRVIAWAIVQARFSSPSAATGGFCGTAWLFERSADRMVFVTASHVAQDVLFTPTEDGIICTLVWLSNGIITIPISATMRIQAENDITFLVVSSALVPESVFVPSVRVDPCSSAEEVYNVGFPNRGHQGNSLRIDLDSRTVSFATGPWCQTGHVLKYAVVDLAAPDVKLHTANALILDYSSEQGFSGGPVLTKSRKQIVGMMSAVIPNRDRPPVHTLAVSLQEILVQKARYLSP